MMNCLDIKYDGAMHLAVMDAHKSLPKLRLIGRKRLTKKILIAHAVKNEKEEPRCLTESHASSFLIVFANHRGVTLKHAIHAYGKEQNLDVLIEKNLDEIISFCGREQQNIERSQEIIRKVEFKKLLSRQDLATLARWQVLDILGGNGIEADRERYRQAHTSGSGFVYNLYQDAIKRYEKKWGHIFIRKNI